MKKILVSLVAMMFLVVPMVFGLSIHDEYYLGSIIPDQPAGQTIETGYVQTLVELGLGGSFEVGNDPQNTVITRSNNDFGELPAPIFVVKFEDAGVKYNFTNMNFTYVLGKYANDAFVWYVFDLTDFVLPTLDQALSHVTFFNSTQKVPEPATLLLFGAGIAGLALYRRKRS